MKIDKLLLLTTFTAIFSGRSFSQTSAQAHKDLTKDGITKPEVFQRRWSYLSETSVVIYWQLPDISNSSNSYLEFGISEKLGSRTPVTVKPGWAHLHRLTDLKPGNDLFYRMVNLDQVTGIKTVSEIIRIHPEKRKDAIRIPDDFKGPAPYILNEKGRFYILTKDIITDGTAVEIAAEGITLDLDGHKVTFGNNTSEQVYGVRFADPGNTRICNGIIVQGCRSRDYSAAIASLERPAPSEIYGIDTDVHLPNAFPLVMTHANRVEIHHNHILSRVTELESRHFPGNSLMRITYYDGNIHIHDNLLSEGCHWAINVGHQGGNSENIEIDHNDIRHHMQYVNGYAISPGPGASVHHNRITSMGRAVHLAAENIRFFDNYIDICGHQDLCDLPERTRPFWHRLIELHGIKLEGEGVKNCKIFNNYVRIIQYLPVDSGGAGTPENKIENGVYIRSHATSLEKNKLVDLDQKWENDRWRYYYVKYNPDLPPALISGNNENTLFGEFVKAAPSEYTIYMKWTFVPPTPLNLACYDPDAMNEIYGNTFIGITRYNLTRNGSDYGDAGEWATAVMLIAMTKGPSCPGKYSAYIHDNSFLSNDLFFNSDNEVNMTILLENNTFTLLKAPFATKRNNRIFNVGSTFEKQIRESKNSFIE